MKNKGIQGFQLENRTQCKKLHILSLLKHFFIFRQKISKWVGDRLGIPQLWVGDRLGRPEGADSYGWGTAWENDVRYRLRAILAYHPSNNQTQDSRGSRKTIKR